MYILYIYTDIIISLLPKFVFHDLIIPLQLPLYIVLPSLDHLILIILVSVLYNK